MPKNRSPINLSAVATRLADQADLWSPLIKFDPVSRYYARLAAEATFEAWLLTWVPGQGTDWHDHGGSAGPSWSCPGRSPKNTRRWPQRLRRVSCRRLGS